MSSKAQLLHKQLQQETLEAADVRTRLAGQHSRRVGKSTNHSAETRPHRAIACEQAYDGGILKESLRKTISITGTNRSVLP